MIFWLLSFFHWNEISPQNLYFWISLYAPKNFLYRSTQVNFRDFIAFVKELSFLFAYFLLTQATIQWFHRKHFKKKIILWKISRVISKSYYVQTFPHKYFWSFQGILVIFFFLSQQRSLIFLISECVYFVRIFPWNFYESEAYIKSTFYTDKREGKNVFVDIFLCNKQKSGEITQSWGTFGMSISRPTNFNPSLEN